jgi:hypothetical protein
MEALGPFVGIGLWLLDRVRDLHQAQRRVRVCVHLALFQGGYGASALMASSDDMLSAPPVTGYADPNAVSQYYHVKVVNLSPKRDIWITHVWFEANPRADILIPQRPLPARLRLEEEWEGWVNAAHLASATRVQWLGRVRLSNGKIVRSRPCKDIPPRGFVGGAGSR